MRHIEAAAALGLACAMLLGGTHETAATLDAMRADVLRLHILASSDSDADQARKLAVRDVLLARSADWLARYSVLRLPRWYPETSSTARSG